TAAIDEHGRVVSRLPEYTQGTLMADVVPRKGMTPYARTGNLPSLAIVGAMLLVGRRRRARA
ncbi:MAG TPA: apolipoprotein N-acyltransferase, partial [Casimicrobiaceae bacterium]|nr:apolipoprotein N-acyltransferase [Casimicrobiaceae bacterium]